MSDHVHEIMFIPDKLDHSVYCWECEEIWNRSEIERCLNVTEVLRAWLRSLISVIEMHREPEKEGFMSDDSLIDMIEKEARQHADILEGKDD